MKTSKIMDTIECQRKLTKTHKNTLCASVGISCTYYNKLLIEDCNPSYGLLKSLLNAFQMDFIVIIA